MNEFELAGYSKEVSEKLMSRAREISNETSISVAEAISYMLLAMNGEIRE